MSVHVISGLILSFVPYTPLREAGVGLTVGMSACWQGLGRIALLVVQVSTVLAGFPATWQYSTRLGREGS